MTWKQKEIYSSVDMDASDKLCLLQCPKLVDGPFQIEKENKIPILLGQKWELRLRPRFPVSDYFHHLN